MFLVDEVGQFIGNDTHLMLNLQTITEQLGTICNGRAGRVIRQEDLDACSATGYEPTKILEDPGSI